MGLVIGIIMIGIFTSGTGPAIARAFCSLEHQARNRNRGRFTFGPKYDSP